MVVFPAYCRLACCDARKNLLTRKEDQPRIYADKRRSGQRPNPITRKQDRGAARKNLLTRKEDQPRIYADKRGSGQRPNPIGRKQDRGAGICLLLICAYPRSSAANSYLRLRLSASAANSYLACFYCGHSLLLRLTIGPKRSWYSLDVMNEQTIACCLGTSRNGAPLTCPNQNKNPGMSGLRRR